MNVPNATINDIPRKDRAKMEKLIAERSCLGYSWSFNKLYKAMMQLTEDDQEARALLSACIVAYSEDEKKEVQGELNNQIDQILAEDGILTSEGKATIEHTDPFGGKIQCLRFTSTSPARFNKGKCVELAASKFGIRTEKITQLLAESYDPGTDYVSVQVRRVKEDSKKGGR